MKIRSGFVSNSSSSSFILVGVDLSDIELSDDMQEKLEDVKNSWNKEPKFIIRGGGGLFGTDVWCGSDGWEETSVPTEADITLAKTYVQQYLASISFPVVDVKVYGGVERD